MRWLCKHQGRAEVSVCITTECVVHLAFTTYSCSLTTLYLVFRKHTPPLPPKKDSAPPLHETCPLYTPQTGTVHPLILALFATHI